MSADEHLAEVVREWVEKAEEDLISAAHLIKIEEKRPRDVICLLAQQCIEKYLKALLVWKQIEFPKTHNIELLVSLIPTDLRPLFVIENPGRISEFAVTTRYPGMYQLITPTEARKAVAAARRVRREVRKLLPRCAKVLREI